MSLRAKAFRGLRYDFKRTPLSSAVCPPYDVIRGPLDSCLRRGRTNAVHVELPRGADPYRSAASLFARWRRTGVLVADAAPAYYVVEQEYSVRGRRMRRTGVLAALGLDRGTASRVLAHERTLSKHKKDRQRLIRAVQANTSPIFGVFADRRGTLARILAASKRAKPLARGRDSGGLGLRLWRVDDPRVTAEVERLLSKETLLIADGHHRYAVGRAHWESTHREGSARLLAFLVSERDPGLVVLPTHRVVEGTFALRRTLARTCRVRPVWDLRALEAALARQASPYALGLVDGAATALLTPAAGDRGVRSRFGTDWLARKVLAGVDPHDISYFHDAREASAEARRTGRIALILKDFSVADIRRAVSRAGLLPQKSTYFYPKIPTGLVFRPFDLDP
ncbi:MAG: DUF1015 domain-containing protein [Elusimicrobia bacterium]|nr:DUF1015 domain-containing protein [Elusimicrobiota bacterium]